MRLTRLGPPPSLRVLWRSASQRLRPPAPEVDCVPLITQRQNAVLCHGRSSRQLARVLVDSSRGPTPTLVLGGFVPDASDAIFLLRPHLRRRGPLYCVHYPRCGFDETLLFAQLDDLLEDIRLRHGRPPLVLAISFGAGLVLEWLRRRRDDGREIELSGLQLVSPVACVEDLLDPSAPKPTTLLGRAIQPYLGDANSYSEKTVERSRQIFAKMFEAGAQNRDVLHTLMTRTELARLRDSVLGNIHGIDFNGACERVQALKRFRAPSAEQPLCHAPTQILYAEKEEAVLADTAPSRALFEAHLRRVFPNGSVYVVRNPRGTPVQHASLIFHYNCFLAEFRSFRRRLGKRSLPLAA